MLFAFVVFGLVSSVLRQEIGWGKVFEVTCFVSTGTENLNSINHPFAHGCKYSHVGISGETKSRYHEGHCAAGDDEWGTLVAIPKMR